MVASIALQVHGGTGYIEETGIAQRLRDIRIAAIYEGTNGIQAIDLVGRKLGLENGAVVRQLLLRVERDALAAGECEHGGTTIAHAVMDAATAVRATTEWLLAKVHSDRSDALAGATPYLRMFGLLLGGWSLARQAIAVQTASLDDEYGNAKSATAVFFCRQILPEVNALLGAVLAGVGDLTGVHAEQLQSS